MHLPMDLSHFWQDVCLDWAVKAKAAPVLLFVAVGNAKAVGLV